LVYHTKLLRAFEDAVSVTDKIGCLPAKWTGSSIATICGVDNSFLNSISAFPSGQSTADFTEKSHFILLFFTMQVRRILLILAGVPVGKIRPFLIMNVQKNKKIFPINYSQ